MTRGPEQGNQLSTAERIFQEHPEFGVYRKAAQVFVRERERKNAPVPPGYAVRLLGRALVNNFPDQYQALSQLFNVPLKNVIYLDGEVLPSDYDRYKNIVRKLQEKQAKTEIMNLLAQRPAILQDEEEIRTAIQTKHPKPSGQPGPTQGNNPNHIRRLSIVRRLRAQGRKHPDIVAVSDIKTVEIVESLVTTLIAHGLTEARPQGPVVAKKTLTVGEIAQRERMRNPKITYSEIAEIASLELNTKVSRRQVKYAVEVKFMTPENRIKSKKTPLEEQFALMDLYIENSQENKPKEPINRKDFAAFLGIEGRWFLELEKRYQRYKETQQNS